MSVGHRALYVATGLSMVAILVVLLLLPSDPVTRSGRAAPQNTLPVLVVNQFSDAVDVELNGTVVKGIKPGEQISVEVTPVAGGHDVIRVTDTVHAGCGMADPGPYFASGHSYRARVYNTGDSCVDGGTRSPSPRLEIELI